MGKSLVSCFFETQCRITTLIDMTAQGTAIPRPRLSLWHVSATAHKACLTADTLQSHSPTACLFKRDF